MIGAKWVLECLSVSPGSEQLPPSGDDLVSLRDEAYKKAGVGKTDHLMRGVSIGSVGRYPQLAPYTIYPFDPDTCARLACDVLSYQSMLAWESLAALFESRGFESQYLQLDGIGPADRSRPVASVGRAKRRLYIPDAALDQVLFELLDLETWVKVLEEVLKEGVFRQGPIFAFIPTFSDERAVWR